VSWQDPPDQKDLIRANRRLAQLCLDALATELRASAGTIDTYTDDLNCYLDRLNERGLGLDDVVSIPACPAVTCTRSMRRSARQPPERWTNACA
jgi:site-specific recombinase XerD